MRAIILAAGRGKRLESVLSGKPKCLLKFGEKTLIQHQISALKSVGVEKIVIVVGYEKEQIINELSEFKENITYIENPIYAKTNTLYSLWLARDYFNDSFIYFNADVLFDSSILRRLLKDTSQSRIACVKDQCGEEEVKIIVKENKIVEIGKKLDPKICYGESIGISLFAKNDNELFKKHISESVKKEENWNNFFEYAVNLLAKDTSLIPIDISDLPATEIDFPEDLELARNTILPQILKNQEKKK